MGPDPQLVRCLGRGVGRQSAGAAESQRARRAGLDRGCLRSLHIGHVESILAYRRPAIRGPRSQSRPAGPRPRHPSAAALSRLCRPLHLVLVRDRRIDRRTHRCRLGALGTAVDAARLDVPHARHRHGLVLGLLHARLGRLVVLGSGGECLFHAVAGGDGAPSLRPCHGEAQRTQGVDHPARDTRLLALADRHISGALGGSHVGSRFCHRPLAWSFHSRHLGAVHRRRACAVRAACAIAQAGGAVRAGFSGRRARSE